MPVPLPRFVSAPHIQRGRAELALLLALMALLNLAAGTGWAGSCTDLPVQGVDGLLAFGQHPEHICAGRACMIDAILAK